MQMTKEGYFDRSLALDIGGLTIHYRHTLPYKAKTWMALDMAEAGLIFDDDLGLVYESYTMDAVTVLLMMRYYTDMDLSDYEGEEGMYQLYDLLQSYDVLEALRAQLDDDMDKVWRIYYQLKAAAQKTFEHRHSLGFLARKSFASMLSTEDLAETLAHSEQVSSQMLDLMDALNHQEKPRQPLGGGLMQFGKRITRDT